MAARLCPYCMQMADSDICPHCGKDVNYAGSPAHLPAGYVVSGKHPYVLGAALGQGGFGITYIALDMVTNARVAIKEYYPTYCSTRTDGVTVTAYSNQEEVYAKGRDRFLDEARTLKSLSDLPNIVDVLDFFELNNTAYLVMEFLEGSSLKEYAAKNGAFPAQAFLKQIRPLMEDIQKMHDRGVIHRDIAPDNIILQPDGQMKLIDFGAARSYIGDKSMTVVVKKGFAPVEQYFSTGSTPATDIYALAATIYYCITGKVPMDSAQRQNEDVPLASPVSLCADITPEQEAALMNALEILQKARTQTVQAFLDALEAQQKAQPVPASAPVTPAPASQKKVAWKKPFAILAALAALVLVGAFLLLSPKKPVVSIQATEPPTETLPVPSAVPVETAASEKNTLDQFFLKKIDEQHEKILGRKVDEKFSQMSGNYTGYAKYRFSIIFHSTMDSVPDNAFDVSEANDHTVKAWFEPSGENYRVHIAAEGTVQAPENSQSLFSSWKIDSIDFNNSFSTKNVTNMSGMFKECSALKKIYLDGFDLSRVENMSSMFTYCNILETVHFPESDTSHLKKTASMFEHCRELKTVNLKDLNTSNVVDMSYMFKFCDHASRLDIASLDTSSVKYYDHFMNDGATVKGRPWKHLFR